MILEFTLALLIGIIAGTFTGLAPGIHINLVSAILLSSLSAIPFLNSLARIYLVVFIVAMAITHSLLDFIPSIFLGAPDEDTALSVLPGHELLKKGRGYEATVLSLYGSLSALIIILIFIPIFILILPKVHNLIASIIPFILIFTSLYLVLREKEFLLSLLIFILAGFLGLITFNLPVKEPLLPLLTGLFGSSALIISIKSKSSQLVKQKISPIKKIRLTKKQFLKTSLAAAISAPLCSFLPGIGSGHAAVIASEITETNNRSFLFLMGSISTIVAALNFVALYAINKARSGTAVAIKSLLKTLSPSDIIIIILTIILSTFIAFILGILIAKLSAKHIHKINYRFLSILTLIFLVIIHIIFTNFLGLVVLIASTSLGIFTILSNSRRINLMACLLVPTILFYLIN